jgi:hypothetical protein
VLGALLVIRVWLPPTFDGIDPENFISARHRSRHPEPVGLEPEEHEETPNYAYRNIPQRSFEVEHTVKEG